MPTKAGIDRIDKLRLRDFLRDVHGVEYPDAESDRLRLLQNLNLAHIRSATPVPCACPPNTPSKAAKATAATGPCTNSSCSWVLASAPDRAFPKSVMPGNPWAIP